MTTIAQCPSVGVHSTVCVPVPVACAAQIPAASDATGEGITGRPRCSV